jgi:uncharacterized repeat protein (TIGR01451 family)
MKFSMFSRLASVALALLFAGFAASSAEAVTPQWTVTSVSMPTNFAPGDHAGADHYQVTLTNTGAASSSGTVAITDELPEGLTLASGGASGEDRLSQAKVACGGLICTYSGAIVPGDAIVLSVPVDVSASPSPSCEVPEEATSCVDNVVRVSGGGAPDTSISTPTVISASPAVFGIASGGATTSLSSVQAGAHPDLTTSIAFNTVSASGVLAGDPKDTTDDLPPGFAGDLVDTPSCTASLFSLHECPIGTQVGITTLTVNEGLQSRTYTEPVYNLSPNSGQVAKLGFSVVGIFGIQGSISVRPGDYGLRTTFEDTQETVGELDSVSLTIWGVPADPIHDPLRQTGLATNAHFGAASDSPRAPFFTNPTSCGEGPLIATFTGDSWQDPGQTVGAEMPFGPIVGCDRLSLEPRLTTQSTTGSAYSPTGLNVDLQVPQTYNNPDGFATSHLRDVKVMLPEGMSLNPSAGSGLGACTEAQFEYEAKAVEPAPELGCPSDSQIGSVHIKSPVIAEEATGSLFVAEPFENRFHSLLALYLIARIPNRGIVVAAAGKISPDPVTGQLTTTFDENPQLPFSDLTLSFHQGATSPLVTPPICGNFITNAVLTPWSVPSQEHDVNSSFDITNGVNGSPCPAAATPPFHPGLEAGTINNAAGSYSPFYVRLSRNDGEQEITHFSFKLPPGLVGKLAGIPFCSDAAIAAAKARTGPQGGQEELEHPSCPAASEVGHTLVEAGVGSVLAQAPGKVYLAGPYHGSNLSIAAITAAKVGPFDLGTVVVRDALKINPETAEVSIDATGSDPIPHIIQGIPVHLRDIRVYVDRPEFILNPTSCERTSIASTVLGSGTDFASEADDQPITVTSPFQAADCASLGFKPKLALSLVGKKTHRGALPGLKAVLTYPKVGAYANIAKAQVTLPESEYLEQGHLKDVCTRKVFESGTIPGENCPAKSIYGHARAVTPLLDQPLEGPVYLRTGYGTKLPELAAALNGPQINIDLAGTIDSVHKKGSEGSRIRNTFAVVPDAPVTKFTLELKGGKKGLLVNSTDVCKGTHKALAAFTGQNGKLDEYEPALTAQCGKGGRKKRSGGKNKGGK